MIKDVFLMELTGNLKKKVESVNTKAEAKEIIKDAGMILTDQELEAVSGGQNSPDGTSGLYADTPYGRVLISDNPHSCPYCGCWFDDIEDAGAGGTADDGRPVRVYRCESDGNYYAVFC